MAGVKHIYSGIGLWILFSCGIPEGQKLPINSTSKSPVESIDNDFHTNNVIGSPDYKPPFQLIDYEPKDLSQAISENLPVTLTFDQDTWTPEAISYLIKAYDGLTEFTFQVKKDETNPNKAVLTVDRDSLKGSEILLKASDQLISKISEPLRFTSSLRVKPRKLSGFQNNICDINTANQIHCTFTRLFHTDFSEETQKELTLASFANPVAVTAGHLSVCATNNIGKTTCFEYATGKNSGPDDLDSHMFSTITASQNGFCGLTLERSVFCWDDGKTDLYTPDGLEKGMIDLQSSSFHQCAKKPFDKELYCRGSNSKSQINDTIPEAKITTASATNFTLKPDSDNPEGVSITSFTAGLNFSCVLSSSGQISCNGKSPDTKALSDAISADEFFTDLWSGSEILCAKTNSDKILCVGSSPFNQFGKSNDSSLFIPSFPDTKKISDIIIGQSFILFQAESDDLFATGIVADIERGDLKSLETLSPFSLYKEAN